MIIIVKTLFKIEKGYGNFPYILSKFNSDLVFDVIYDEYKQFNCNTSVKATHLMIIEGELKNIDYEIVYELNIDNKIFKLIKFKEPINNTYTLDGGIAAEFVYPMNEIEKNSTFYSGLLTYCDIIIAAEKNELVKLNGNNIVTIEEPGYYIVQNFKMKDTNIIETINPFIIIKHPGKISCTNQDDTLNFIQFDLS